MQCPGVSRFGVPRGFSPWPPGGHPPAASAHSGPPVIVHPCDLFPFT